MRYRNRVVDHELAKCLGAAGAVLIEGPRACGKTATARNQAKSEVMLDVDRAAQEIIAAEPSLILEGESPRLIDEWQTAPVIWNYLRRAVDDRTGTGHFILTGSAVPAGDVTRHTGAGRIVRLRLRPMSLFEQGRSSGQVSLADLLAGGPSHCSRSDQSVRDLSEIICVGGWPGQLDKPAMEALRVNRSYLSDICRADMQRVDGVLREPGLVNRFLQSLARNISTTASLATIAKDVAGHQQNRMKDHTARAYLNVLERLFVVEDQPPWAAHLRSRARLQQSSKRHFVDPSIAVAALRLKPHHLLQDFALFGLFFESLVIRDLRIYAQAADSSVHHYRDDSGLEVDAIIDAGPGRWAAFEVKLGTGRIDEAAQTLKKFSKRVDTERCGAPACLGIIVDRGFGYRRQDGIDVIPIGALGP